MLDHELKSQKWRIVQFHKTKPIYRFVNEALFDGYAVGDRFLEGVMFKITVPNGEIKVEADADACHYLNTVFSDPKKWELRVKNYLESDGYEDLETFVSSKEWDGRELHLTDDCSYYEQNGLTLKV